MKLYYKLLIGLTLALIYSCNPSDQNNQGEAIENDLPPEERAEKNLQDEVLGIHDEVMPRMDELMRLKEQLIIKVDSLTNLEEDNNQVAELQVKIEQLRKSDSAMMTWMRQFKAVRDSVSHEERINYLTKEKERIEMVRAMMQEAIKDAKEELEN